MPAGHHSFGDLDELVELESRVGLAVPPGERRNPLWRNLRAVDVRAGADDAASRQHRSDSRLRVVADEASEKLESSIAYSRTSMKLNWPIRVLEIAGGASGTEVHPAANIRAADKSGVTFVRMSQHDRGRDLAAHLANISDRARADCITDNVRFLADVAGSDNSCERCDRSAPADEDRTIGRIENHERLDPRSGLTIDPVFSDCRRVHDGPARKPRSHHGDVVTELIAKLADEIPHFSQPPAGDGNGAGVRRSQLFKRYRSIGQSVDVDRFRKPYCAHRAVAGKGRSRPVELRRERYDESRIRDQRAGRDRGISGDGVWRIELVEV